MKKFKRDLFFWIERLQITRNERVVISSLLVVVVLLWAGSFFLKSELVTRENDYTDIKAEFQEKSAALALEKQQELEKYSPTNQVESNETESSETKLLTELSININTSDVDELQLLKGIGKTYAQRIIDYREKNGNFKSAEELINIKGIGRKRLDAIKPFITVE